MPAPLKLAFIDWGQWDYDTTYPLRHPMGGSESALCYLAARLAARGHAITLINGSTSPSVSEGVRIIPNRLPRDYFQRDIFDAVVVIKGPADMTLLKSCLPTPTKLLLWTGHASDQPPVQPLGTQAREAWDGIIAVSSWQRSEFVQRFSLSPGRVHVLRNAISPAFEKLFASRDELKTAKSGSLRLAYTSTPFRGLDTLLGIFQQLNHACAHLDIYSSMQVYGTPASGDGFAPLYQAAQAMRHVHYIGSIEQAKLATAMKGVAILSYPNSFAETSCIAIMEAMAAGCFILSSDLGALAETTAGFGTLIARHDASAYTGDYLKALQATIAHIEKNADAFAARQWEQVAYANKELTWTTRAGEWEALLEKLCRA